MTQLVRDFNIWNMLKYGSAHVPAQLELPVEKVETSYPLDEKTETLNPSSRTDVCGVKTSRHRIILKHLLYGALAVFGYFYLRTYFKGTNLPTPPFRYQDDPRLTLYNYDTGNPQLDQLQSSEPKEIISVGYPYIPDASYGEAVYHTTLVNHTFGQSYGKPAVTQFKTPDVAFNRVVLTLKTEVENVQYDRLVNIFVDGVQIWRTSTIEPGNRAVFSVAKKDVSTYLNLFKKDSTVLFQLDNLLTKRLTGEFQIELTADFYNSEEELADEFALTGTKHAIFKAARPADKIYPLVTNKNASVPPIAYLPWEKINVQLPSVSKNTTRLRLSILTSGNGDEEFWYGNVLDKFKDNFADHGRRLPGHGPIRIVNVFFNGEKIATQAPEPVVFTGGLSPALWSSVVSLNAFDVPSIDVDLTGLLPHLWESQSIEDKYLEIEISNGLGETGKGNKRIGSNWITTANLLTYENADVDSVSGTVVDLDLKKKSDVVAFSNPFTKAVQQIINSDFSTSLTSDLSFLLKNGEAVNITLLSKTGALVQNVQSYSNLGSKQSVVHSARSFKSYSIKLGDEVVHEVTSKAIYPLVLSVLEVEKSIKSGNFNIEYDVSLVAGRSISLKDDKEFSFKNSAYQNGSSKYVLSSEGNHGYGSLNTNYTVLVKNKDQPKERYHRRVLAVNGSIVLDEEEHNGESTMLEMFDFTHVYLLVNHAKYISAQGVEGIINYVFERFGLDQMPQLGHETMSAPKHWYPPQIIKLDN